MALDICKIQFPANIHTSYAELTSRLNHFNLLLKNNWFSFLRGARRPVRETPRPCIAGGESRRGEPKGISQIELNESASKSKTRDRNHRDRKKLYVKSMEDEVLRLQEEWAAVLREIERATEESLILKDILRGHPLLISSPASSQRAPSGRTTKFF
jgi:hypothetical protein